MNNKKVTIIIDFKIYYYLMKPIIKQLINRNFSVLIYGPKYVLDLIRYDCNYTENIELINYSKIKRKTVYLKALHQTIFILFTPHNYSIQYKRQVKRMIKKKYDIRKFLYVLSYLTPKSSNINNLLFNLLKYFIPKVFPTKDIIVGSANPNAYLLCNNSYNVITIMESWDHAVKIPNGYISNTLYSWNKELSEDWVKYQKDKNVKEFFPLKLRYAYKEIYLKKLYTKKKHKNKCVYAVASTKKYSVKALTEIEHKIINKLCIATKMSGWELYIKPRPIGDVNEFDYLMKDYKHVSVGYIKEGDDIAANYYLDDDYNRRRFEEILDAKMVINCFTTFGLDAAAAGVPVLQLDVSGDIELKDSEKFYNNHHIRKYLLSSKNIFTLKDNERLEYKLSKYLKGNANLHEAYSSELREWLFSNNKSEEAAINSLIDSFDYK